MNTGSWKIKLFFFSLGIVFTLSILVLTGATQMRYGGYPISAWAAADIGYGCYILDTNTGVTKIVYQSTGSPSPVVDNLNKPFGSMQ